MNLGAHMSVAGGLHKSLERALSIGCHSVQIFTKNNNQWNAKPFSEKDVIQFSLLKKEFQPNYIFVHDSYLINLASPKEETYQKSFDAFIIEMQRVEDLGLPFLVMHPGSHLKQGEEWGIQKIIDSFNLLFQQTCNFKMKVLLETTAGQGTNLGYKFDHLGDIIQGVDHPQRLGICVDTCHIFAAGYDIRTEKGYHKVFDEFDKKIGLSYIQAFHLNDSKKEFGSRVDRHEHIGKGYIGVDAFGFLMKDERFKDIPMVLETPKGKEMLEDIENLNILRSLK